MKNYFLLSFICILTLISCKQNKISSGDVKGENSINISKSEYDSLIALSNQLYELTSTNLTKYEIEDKLAKKYVQYYLKKPLGGTDYGKERSVFFTFKEIMSAIKDTSIKLDSKELGFRVYFARYKLDTDDEKSYINERFGRNADKIYDDKQTVILQIMNDKNNEFIFKNADKTDLLNYNLGELCPPCSSSNNASGLDGDEYLKKIQ